MKIETKFNIGDKAFTIDSKKLKVKEFTVGSFGTYTNRNKETSVTIYDEEGHFNGVEESKCFHTEAELITFITKKDEPETL